MSKIRIGLLLCIIVFWISAIHAQTPDEAWIMTDIWQLTAPPESGISQVVISPDGTKMVVVYAPSDPFALSEEEQIAYAQFQTELWDIPTRAKIATLPTETGNLWHVEISPNGQYIRIRENVTRDVQQYTLWDMQTGDYIRAISGDIYSPTFSPDDATISYFDGVSQTLFVTDTRTGEVIAQTDPFESAWEIAHHPQQTVLAIGSQVQRDPTLGTLFYDIYLWDYVSNQITLVDNTNLDYSLPRLEFLMDGAYLSWYGTQTRYVYDLTQADFVRVTYADYRMLSLPHEQVTISITLTQSTHPFKPDLYIIADGTRYATISEGPIAAGVFFSPDERYLFTIVFADMHQWDAQTGAYLGMVYDDPEGTYNQYVFLPDSSQLWVYNTQSSIIRIFMARG